jgi:uncharacterized oligopeptide transporter (OPT) family protein
VLTVRAVAAGLVVGAVLCFSNTYFGLQTGWVTMGSLQVGMTVLVLTVLVCISCQHYRVFTLAMVVYCLQKRP